MFRFTDRLNFFIHTRRNTNSGDHRHVCDFVIQITKVKGRNRQGKGKEKDKGFNRLFSLIYTIQNQF